MKEQKYFCHILAVFVQKKRPLNCLVCQMKTRRCGRKFPKTLHTRTF